MQNEIPYIILRLKKDKERTVNEKLKQFPIVKYIIACPKIREAIKEKD